MANPVDTTYHIIAETTAGVTPATPAFQKIDHIPGTMPAYKADFLDSPLLKPNRSPGAGRKLNYHVEGGVQTQLKRDAAHDIFMQSLLSGTFATNVLKNGATDSSFTIEQKMIDTASLYKRFNGCQVQQLALDVDSQKIATASWDIIGMGMASGTAIVTGATYTAAASTLALTGLDVTSCTIAGVTATYRAAKLTISRDGLEALDQFGSTAALAVRQGGTLKAKLALTFYRADLSPETALINDTPIAVSFTIGAANTGYTFTMPAAVANVPEDGEEGAKALVTVEFTASYDNTSGCAVQVTKL